MDNEKTSIPNITDKRIAPPGLLPRNIQAWVLGGVALLMVLIIAFSGGLSSKPKTATTTPSAPSILQPNEDKLKEYQKRIDEQARKLAFEQAQLSQTAKTFTAPLNAPGTPMSSPGQEQYAYTSRIVRNEPSPEMGIKKKIEEEKQQLEYKSLFASNLVLSSQSEPKQAASDSAPATPPIMILPDPRSYGLPQLPTPVVAQSAPETVQAPGTLTDNKSSPNKEKVPKTPQPDLNRAAGKGYRLFEGTVIETVLTNRLDGTFSGPANCMVSYDVYSHDHNHVLIPSGSRVLGEVHQVDSAGQQRLAVTFHRLIMPDGYSFNLDQFHGLDQVGETGLRDKVNHHYAQIFGASIAIGIIAGLAQTNTQSGAQISAADAYRQGVANSLTQSSMHVLDRFLNILPTFTIREGQRIKIYLAEDITLPAYENHEMQDNL